MTSFSARCHLAQVNIGRTLGAMTDPIMIGFASQLDTINRLAEESAGFVWRLKTEEGNATALRPFADDRMLINMSVWESIESLFEFTYKSAHTPLLGQRADWFERLSVPIMTLWWLPAETLPTVEAAGIRLEHLQRHGPTAFAFNFKMRFPAEPEAQPLDLSIEGKS